MKFLDEIKPTAVLIEGLSDASEQIGYFAAKGTKPPIAILAYTEELPVRTILTPFAEYSPEYQGVLWALKNKAHVEFIDLPSDVFLKLEYSIMDEEIGNRGLIYSEWARVSGEDDHETYWERNFEHNLSKDSYRLSAIEFGKSLRELTEDSRIEHAENLVREAFMRRKIRSVLESGHDPDRVVVITGAYHTPALGDGHIMTDDEFESLPRVKSRLTLMPYSYLRLSSKTGYGAGNSAPAYFSLMWDSLCREDLKRLPSLYLSSIASYMRERGTVRSSAEVIEGVRLSESLASLRGGIFPALCDLRDAALSCLGHGDFSQIAEAAAHTETGTAIGSLPEGVSRTSIQDDFYRQLKNLKLEKYKSTVAMNLELDLRENRRVKSLDAAFLDLNRSSFLHRLRILGVSFQKMGDNRQDGATWAENWVLRWTPESEIELVESALLGETVEIAASYVFSEKLSSCDRISNAAVLIKEACRCSLMSSMEQARVALQRLAADSGAFTEVVSAASELSTVISYGDVRRFDPSSLIPLLSQLFLRSALLIPDAANCDNKASNEVSAALNVLNNIALRHFEVVDEDTFIKKLVELSDRDDRNPRLSGYACSILLERGIIDGEKLASEVSRRLSPGIDADLGAGWFEGLSMRNRYALLARLSLWEQLDGYVSSLDEEQFKRALVFLRRAFGDFGPNEKRSICENLGEIWGIDKEEASDVLQRELGEEEKNSIDELNDFDFGDI
ncbi:MAG TPA: DUF5682 family protein [Clostridia bacterium]